VSELRTALVVGEHMRLFRRLGEEAQFLYVQRLKGFSVPTSPHFESDDAAAWFVDKLQNSQVYLEFGSGGSTYLAAKLKKRFVTVDSDYFFLKAVRKKIVEDGLLDNERQRYRYANIGITRRWGWPLGLLKPGKKRLALYSKYSDFPLDELRGAYPDLVLIDGRFRVACALKAIRALGARANWCLVVDDYRHREGHYKIIERFAELQSFVGRMAVFSKMPQLDNRALMVAIRRYETDPS